MTDTTLIELSRPAPRHAPLGSLARHLVFSRLELLSQGLLRLREGKETLEFGTIGTGLEAGIEVLDPAFYAELAFGGSVGAAESYMLGHWRADDLTQAMRLLLRNRHAMDAMEGGLARLSSPLRVAAHWLHRNTRAGSRRNISAHYDLGNDFFRLMLDETMMYSSAIFEQPEMSLKEASVAKLEAICRKLDLGPGDHVLEIGTGWGGFALHAARTRRCRVTTTTISPSQHALAQERIREAGLEDRITLLQQDYRDLTGTYDKLVSIEMIEAVGHQYYAEFFRCCEARLKPGGKMLVQAITIAEQEYLRARDEVDFIKKYIFPGCCIPSLGALNEGMRDGSRMRLVHVEDIGPHYATTLARWRENFFRNLDAVRAMGYPDSFLRMWEFYLCYCEAGFAERALGDLHLVLERD